MCFFGLQLHVTHCTTGTLHVYENSKYRKSASFCCKKFWIKNTNYRRPGFNCGSILNANCDLSPIAQLLERNYYYYAMINSVHDPRVNVNLQLRLKMTSYTTWRLLPDGNNLPTPDKAGLLANITKEVNELVERAIAGNRLVPDNGAKGKYDRQICSWEWQPYRRATLHPAAPCDYSRSATGSVQKSRGGCGQM